tara:strand:- start:380 stop:658 length:279 start_codon:yes stop_codon:yes gene_type:complete
VARKIIAIADSSNPTIIDYMKNQLQSIKNTLPSVSIELVDETDSRLERYVHADNRAKLPMLMAFKGDVFTSVKFGKRDTDQVVGWCKELGIE